MAASQRSVAVSAKCAAASWAEERRPFTDPIEIPAPSGAATARREDTEYGEGDYGGSGSGCGGEVVPPHVLLARRRAAFSMCSGQGRTLKGRDLRRFRNDAFRQPRYLWALGHYPPSKKMLRIEQQQLDKEEFQEADILWPDAAQDLDFPQMYYSLVDADEDDDEHRSVKQHGNRQKASSPIDIPARKVSSAGAKGARAPAGFSKFGQTLAGAGGGSFFVGSHVFVPPHVIVDHRRAKREKAMMMLVVPKGRARKMVMRE
uniref:Uncharacterized protein n=1 Tax=Oryza glumipatula TaxID=40148 RepID=A0A0D9YEG0_9ORYZ